MKAIVRADVKGYSKGLYKGMKAVNAREGSREWLLFLYQKMIDMHNRY